MCTDYLEERCCTHTVEGIEETDKRTRRLTSALWILWKNRKKIGNLIVKIPLNYVETDNRL